MRDVAFAASLLAGLLVVAGLLTAPIERRVYRSDLGTPRKLLAYAIYLAILWALTVAAASIYPWQTLIASPGPILPWLPSPAIAVPIIGGVLAIYFIIALMPLFQSLRGLRRRKAYAAAARRAFPELPGFLPNTAAECAAFVLMSVTAGVCEETLYRGFLIRFLHEGVLALPLIGALAASSLAFGLGHAYMGRWRVLTTALGGCGFGLLYLLSGSLVPCIVLHALVDMQFAYILLPIPEEADATLEAA